MKWEPETLDVKVGSFLPYLRWAVQNTAGPILELGGGYASTPYLASTGRELVTYEFDPEWAEVLRGQFSHPIVESYGDIPDRRWGVCLVDCEGWARRLLFLAADADVYCVHDSQDDWIPEEDLNGFSFRADFDEDPKTTLVSNRLDVRRCQ